MVKKANDFSKEELIVFKKIYLSNPWVLNMDDFEIDSFIENKLNDGVDSCDILEMLCRGDIW